MTIRNIAQVAIFVALTFTQQVLLQGLIGIQFTFFLIVVMVAVLGWRKTIMVMALHSAMIAMHFGGWLMLPFQMLGYGFAIGIASLLLPMMRPWVLAFGSALSGILYLWLLVIPSVWIYQMPLIPYILADLPFQAIMAATNFFTVGILSRAAIGAIKQSQSMPRGL